MEISTELSKLVLCEAPKFPRTGCKSKDFESLTMSVWILPIPFFSHVLSSCQLAAQLARHGLRITLFLTSNDHERVSSHSQLLPRWKHEGLDIQVRLLDCESAVLADTVGDPQRLVKPMLNAEEAYLKLLAEAVKEGTQPPCAIYDFCAPVAAEGSTKLGVPSWMYSAVSGSCLASVCYVYRLQATGILQLPATPLEKVADEELICLPGQPPLRVSDMADLMFTTHPLHESMTCHNARVMEKTEVILVNSFHDMEPRGYHALKQILSNGAKRISGKDPTVMEVGPTCNLPFNSKEYMKTVKENGDGQSASCIKFLDSQPTASVIYVAFGGDVNLTVEQIRELVYGLASTEHPFLCTFHTPKKSDSESPVDDPLSGLPEEFLSSLASRSLFVKWAPQQEILSHPSTGAFITHCGYNSLIESVAMGVPILAWPWQYEQYMNARLLVDEVRVAMEVLPGLLRNQLVGREAVEKAVKRLFHSEEGEAVRKRAVFMRQRAEEAVGPQGSTTANIRALVARIQDLESKQKGETQ